jgi:hypothetical protein
MTTALVALKGHDSDELDFRRSYDNQKQATSPPRHACCLLRNSFPVKKAYGKGSNPVWRTRPSHKKYCKPYSSNQGKICPKRCGWEVFFCSETGIKYLANASKPTNHTLGDEYLTKPLSMTPYSEQIRPAAMLQGIPPGSSFLRLINGPADAGSSSRNDPKPRWAQQSLRTKARIT